MSLPPSPRFKCDNRTCISGFDYKRKDEPVDYISKKTPENLVGSPTEVLATGDYFPYDDDTKASSSSSVRGNEDEVPSNDVMEEAVGDASSEAEEASVNPAVTPLRMSPEVMQRVRTQSSSPEAAPTASSVSGAAQSSSSASTSSSSSVEEIPPPESPTRSPFPTPSSSESSTPTTAEREEEIKFSPTPSPSSSSSSSSSGAAGTAPQSIPMELSSSTEEEGSGGDLNPPPSASPLQIPLKRTFEITRPVTQKMPDLEIIRYKFKPMRTFILNHDSGKMTYLVQFVSFYGDPFFIKYIDPMVLGEEVVVLYERSIKTIMLGNDELTAVLFNNPDLVTLFNNSILYNKTVYSQIGTSDFVSHNPSTYPLIGGPVIDSPKELALEAHNKMLAIDTTYRSSLRETINVISEDIYSLGKDIAQIDEIFKSVDDIIIGEMDEYYHHFSKIVNTDRYIPSEDKINRIRYLGEHSNKYLQVYSMVWNRMKDRLNSLRDELYDTSKSIFAQMKKDFPEIEGIPDLG